MLRFSSNSAATVGLLPTAQEGAPMAEEQKTERVIIRVSPSDLTRLKKAAASADLTMSEYLRSLIGEEHLEVLRLELDPSVLASLLFELKRQGNNLNQLAMRANRNSSIDASEVSTALVSCRSAVDSVMQLIEETRPHK